MGAENSETTPITLTPPEGLVPPGRMAMISASLTNAKEYATEVFKNKKPWGELMDRSSFSKPESMSEASTRIRKNLAYFRVNYMIIVVASLVLCILFSPSSLIVLSILLAIWGYVFVVRTAPLQIGSRTLSDREKLMGLSAFSFVTVFFLTSMGALLFSAFVMGCTIVALHGAMRVPDDLFTDDLPQGGGGLWSAITGGATLPVAISTNV